MRFTFRFLLFFLFSHLIWTGGFAQTPVIDSLKNELEIHQQRDTIQALNFYRLAFEYFRWDQNLTLTYLQKAEELSDSLNYTAGKARVFYLRGILESIQSNFSESLKYFEQSLDLYESIQDQNGIANILTAFGITHSSLSEYDQALFYYRKAADIYQKTGNERELITTLINSANVYSETGRYEEAISNFEEALYRSEATLDQEGVASVQSNMGVIYQAQGNYPMALESFNKSLDYKRKTNDSLSMAVMLYNIGDTYHLLKKTDKALESFREALNLAQKNDYTSILTALNSSLGKIYAQRKEYEKSLIFYRISMESSQELGNVRQTAISLIHIGEVYLALQRPSIARENFSQAIQIAEETGLRNIQANGLLGMAETYLDEKDYGKALPYSDKANQIGKDLELMEVQKNAAHQLSEIFENTGQYQKALVHYQTFKSLNDNLFNKENIEKITQLEYEYKYKQALDSANIRELKLTKTVFDTSQDLAKTRQNYLWAIIGVLLISIALGTLIFIEKLENEKSKTKNVIVEQKLLRSQMTPHFIFNSLSVLQGMILNKEEAKSVNYLSKFSKLLRIILENSRDKLVLLSKEITAMENYLSLHNLEDNQFDYSILIAPSIDTQTLLIPPMLIQPFVENAIEHAFHGQSGKNKIDISLRMDQGQLICTISDNGIGIESQAGNRSNTKKSLATTITSERLKILSKDLKMKGEIHISDKSKFKEKGTLVTLTIPYKPNQVA